MSKARQSNTSFIKCLGGFPIDRDCPHIAYSCGLCSVCFIRSTRNARQGKCTREELVKQGRMLPARKRVAHKQEK